MWDIVVNRTFIELRPQGLRARARSQSEPAICTATLPEVPEGRGAREEEVLNRTTLMFRNLPCYYRRRLLQWTLDAEGCRGCYDFLYVPIDFVTGSCLGYAFVNAAGAAEASKLRDVFDGYRSWPIPCKKACSVSWAERQGIDICIESFRNSTLMHEATPDTRRPAIYNLNGERVTFPQPTRKLRLPRQLRMARRR